MNSSEYLNQLQTAIKEIDSDFYSREWTKLDELVYYQSWLSNEEISRELNILLQKEAHEVLRNYDLAQDVLYMSHKRGRMTEEERYLAEHFIAFCYMESIGFKSIK